jgi:MFS family permease
MAASLELPLDELSNVEQHRRISKDDAPSLYPVQSRFERPQSLPREIAFVAILCMAQFTCQAGLGQSIAPLHIIGDSFRTRSPGQLSWFAAAYSLTVGTFILIAGRLGDVYGHKKFFIAGFLWFALWSLLAGFSVYSTSTGPIFFDCCRAFQGIGPAFLLPNAIAILGRAYEPGRRKEMVFSFFGATAPSGFVFGAVFSAIFGQLTWWPIAYMVMAATCLVLAFVGFLVIPHTPCPEFDTKDGISMADRVDVWGSITGVTALVLINFAWNQGPVVGWTTPYTYVLLIIGLVFLGLFAFIQSRASFPLVPIESLTSDTAFILGCIAAGWSSFGIWMFYIWQFMEEIRLETPLLASAHFVPIALSGLCAAVTTGFILSRVPPSVVMMVAMVAFTVGGVLIATAPVHQSYWAQTFVSIVIMPWGMDMSFPAATILLSNTMHRDHQGVAASLVNTVVNYSISIGLGFAGTIESQVNDGGADILKGYRGAWYMGVGLSGLGMFISALYGFENLLKSRRGSSSGPAVSIMQA